jgi:eukaryotic-like serine/threonine-protein kinase
MPTDASRERLDLLGLFDHPRCQQADAVAYQLRPRIGSAAYNHAGFLRQLGVAIPKRVVKGLASMIDSGTRLGPYVIAGPIGSGGMGEVYRARDPRLGRDVAVKVLPGDLSTDSERLTRFEQEARAAASLNHPNIVAVYDIGQHDGSPYIVSELLEGETLGQRLHGGGLPVRKAVEYAIQIAHGLAVAHEKGIVHRDLKPENIFVTTDGRLKILDFGLAKLTQLEPALAGASTLPTTLPHTMPGTVLGTIGYMAPEQVRGLPADQRSDIFAFGAIVYEMLSGQRAFHGETAADTMSAILATDPPDLAAADRHIPPALGRIVDRCLEKSPPARFKSADDLAFALENAAGGSSSNAAVETVASTPVRATRIRPRIAQALAVFILATAAFLAGTWWTAGRDASPVQWRGERLGGSTVAMGPSVSPDGQRLAFQAMVGGLTQVAVMTQQSGDWAVLTQDRSRGAIATIGWSRDGTALFFDRVLDGPRGIFRVPVLGGEERIVLEDAMGPVLLPDGSLLITRINSDRAYQLHRFWPETGRVDALQAVLSARVLYPAVRVFPDGREAVFFGRPLDSAQTADHLHVIDLTSGRVRRIVPAVSISPASWLFPLAVTHDGQSVLFDLAAGNLHRIVAVPRDGSAQVRPIVTLTETPQWLDMGPDGSLYVDQIEQPADLLRFAPASGAVERIPLPGGVGSATGTSSDSMLPLPDGRVLLASRIVGRNRILVMAAGKDPVPFVATDEEATGPLAMVGADTFVFVVGTAPTRRLALASVADGRITRRLTRVEVGGINAMAGSPDGSTIFYADSGTVWAVPAADGEPRKIRGGNDIAVEPHGLDLLIALTEPGGVRLIRRPISGGSEQVVPLPGDLRLAPVDALNSNAIGRDGHIAMRVAPMDSWYWPSVIFDPATGRVDRIPGSDQADLVEAGWANDGRLVTVAQGVRGSLWRFRPESEAR